MALPYELEEAMHAYSSIHPTLAGLLQFEEQRLGLPIEVVKKPLYNLAPNPPFRPVIEVRIHTGTRPESFPILLADELLEITTPVHVTNEAREVGFTDATGQFCPIAGVTDNRVTIHFDLAEVFYAGNVRRKPTNGTAPTGNPGNKVADLVFGPAFAIALGNIRRYDWKRETEEYTSHVVAARQKTVDEWSQSYRQNERSLEEKSWEIQELARKNGELRQRIRTHDQLTRKRVERKARDDHSGLVKLLGRGLRSIEVDGGVLKAITTPIEIFWGEVNYEMGQYIISIPLGEGRLTINSRDGHEVEGYPHPHVASDGAPCLGNMGATVAQLLGEGEHFQLVTTLLEFLRSYNPDNPYLRLERWDPDWEDEEDRFESCYNDASLSDCATCNDWDCPHREGAESRCNEHTDTNDCIECASCNRHRDAIDHCRENHESHQCVTCETDCTHAGDVEVCFEAHAGELCTGCPNDDCNHNQENNDENDC